VGVLDCALASGRRFVLFALAYISLVVDVVHLPPSLPFHTIKLGGVQLEYYDMSVLIPALSITLTHPHAFFARASIIMALFHLDILASSRAWQICGFVTPGSGVVDLIARCVGSCTSRSPSQELVVRPYFKLKVAPGNDDTLSAQDDALHRPMSRVTTHHLNEQQQTLCDALETLHEYFRTSAEASHAFDLGIATSSEGRRCARDTNPMIDLGCVAYTQEVVAGTSYARPLDMTKLGHRAADECATMLKRLHHMSTPELTALEIAISNFVPPLGAPSDDIPAARDLIEELIHVRSSSAQKLAQGEHLARRVAANTCTGASSFRSLPLKTALSMPQLWSRAGHGYTEGFYALSKDSPSAMYFLSHCWADPGLKKLTQMQNALCTRPLITSLLIYLPTLAVLLCPLGLSLHSITVPTCTGCLPSIQLLGIVHVPVMFVPSLLPMVGLCGSLVWIFLSTTSCLPIALTPWGRIKDTEIWLDHACVDKERLPCLTIAAHTKFISKCDRMIAMVSSQYCMRLWCVFELATFCRRYSGPLRWCLDEDMIVLSSCGDDSSPSKETEFPTTELTVLRRFRCRAAQVFRPMDRARILSYIRCEWGSEEAFDKFVQTELTEILASCSVRHSKSTYSLLMQRLDLCFGS